MFWGPVLQSSSAVSADSESPRSSVSPATGCPWDHSHHKHIHLASAMAIVCPQNAPKSCMPTWELYSHTPKPFFLTGLLTLFLEHPTSNVFCPFARPSACRYVIAMSPFLLYTKRTLFQQLSPLGSRMQSLSNYLGWLLQWEHLSNCQSQRLNSSQTKLLSKTLFPEGKSKHRGYRAWGSMDLFSITKAIIHKSSS